MSANHTNRLWAQSPLGEIVVHTLGGDWGKDVENVIADYELARVVRGTDFKTWSDEKGAGAAKRKIKKTSIEKRRLAEGDLVVEISGGGPAQPVGRTVLIDEAALANCSLPLICSNFFRQVRLNKEVEARFVNFFLKYSHQQGAFNELQTETTNLRNLNFNRFLAETIIPLPPLPEQRRIVAKLEELFTRADACRKRLDHIPRLLKQFRQSVLNSAITGRLTADWRKQNRDLTPIDFPSLEKEREALIRDSQKVNGVRTAGYKPAVRISLGGKTRGVDELFELPSTWQWVSLGQVTWDVSDGPHFSPKYLSTGVPFISARNITYRGIDFQNAKYISQQDHANFIKRTKPEYEDVLLTKGGTTGVATVVDTHDEFSIWVHVALLKVIRKFVSPHYLRDALSTDFVYKQSQEQTHGVTNQDLGLTRMVYMAVPLPPLAEQQEIVRRVEALFKIADTVEEHYQKAQEQLDTLPQSILSKAFRGELVPQDPNDEPASAMLDRIREYRLTGT